MANANSICDFVVTWLLVRGVSTPWGSYGFWRTDNT